MKKKPQVVEQVFDDRGEDFGPLEGPNSDEGTYTLDAVVNLSFHLGIVGCILVWSIGPIDYDRPAAPEKLRSQDPLALPSGYELPGRS